MNLPWKHTEWNSIDGWLLPLLVSIMRMCWIWPWMLLLQSFLSPSVAGPLLPQLLLVSLPILSFSLARWSMPTFAERRNLRQVNQVRLYIAGSGFVTILGLLWLRFLQMDFALWDLRWLLEAGYRLIYWDSVPAEVPGTFLFLLLTMALWLRGALDGQGQFGHEEIWRAFLWGGAALVLFALIFARASNQFANLVGQMLLFAAAGLAGLAVANLQISSSGWRRTSWAGSLRFIANRSWLLGICLTISMLLGVALLINFLIQPEDAAILFRGLGVLLQAIGTVLFWIVAVIAYPFFIIADYLAQLIRQLLAGGSQEREQEPMALPEPLEPRPEAAEQVMEAMPEPYRWVVLVAIAIVVFIVFVLVLRQLRRRAVEEQEEMRESIFCADLLQSQLADLWSRWCSRFARAPEEPHPYLPIKEEMDTRRVIRSIYQQLLAVAKTQMLARLQAETPHTYGNRLSWQLSIEREEIGELNPATPTLQQAMQIITRGYIEARYGDAAPSHQTAQNVQRAWQQIEAVLLEMDRVSEH